MSEFIEIDLSKVKKKNLSGHGIIYSVMRNTYQSGKIRKEMIDIIINTMESLKKTSKDFKDLGGKELLEALKDAKSQ